MESDKGSKAPRRHKRQMKNYLLDRHFQLKYAGILFGVAAALSLVLGLLLWNTSKGLVDQSRQAVESGKQATTLAKQVAAESEKVSAVVRMNIVEDPFYKDNPEVLAAFQEEQKQQDDALAAQQQKLEDQAAVLEAQAAGLETQQRAMLLALFVLLALLVIGVGFAGIIITHKVAGPIFKMTRQIREVGEGHYRVPSPLRKGDELVHFFGAFRTMVQNLREQREKELALLAEAELALEAEVNEEKLAPLKKLRVELARATE